MANDTNEDRKRNQQTLNMLVSFPPENLDGVMKAIAEDETLQGITFKPGYIKGKPSPRYDIYEKGTEIASIIMLTKKYTCVFASEGETVEKLKKLLSDYSDTVH